MATSYPGALDDFADPTPTSRQNAPSHAGQHKNANDAIEAIEAELGTHPSGTESTVKARLEKIEDGTRLGVDSVGSSQIAADAVGSSQIAANAVGSSELADNAVDTAAIQNNAVTDPKVPVGALGPTKIAGEALTKALFDAKGDLIAGSADNAAVRVPAGADGTLLGYDSTKPGGLGTFQVGNLLSANQATGGDTLGNTTGFGVGGNTIARDTGNAYQGTGSIKATRTSAGISYVVCGGAGEYLALDYTLPVTEGVAYTATATVRSDDSTEALTLRVRYYTSGGTRIGGAYYNAGVALSTDWYTHTLVTTAPATAAFAEVWVEKSQAAETTETWNTDAIGFWRGSGGNWAPPGLPVTGTAGKAALRSLSATTHTLEAYCAGQLVEFTAATAVSVYVPPFSSVPFPVGTTIDLLQAGTGAVTVVQGSGVTVNANPGLHLAGQWASATLINRAKDTWVLVGNLSAT